MNPLSIELYKRYKKDITRDPLEFAVNNQHMNGGCVVDIWGEQPRGMSPSARLPARMASRAQAARRSSGSGIRRARANTSRRPTQKATTEPSDGCLRPRSQRSADVFRPRTALAASH